MEITYNLTRSDLWHRELYSILHRRRRLIFWLVFYVISSVGMSRWWAIVGSSINAGWHTWWEDILTGFVLSSVVFVLAPTLGTWITINRLLPTPDTKLACTALVTTEFLSNTTSGTTMQYVWKKITKIYLHKGDFWFWYEGIPLHGVCIHIFGACIPRGAFSDPRQTYLFYETAMAYWHSARSGQPVLLPQDGRIWPPPPRLG